MIEPSLRLVVSRGLAVVAPFAAECEGEIVVGLPGFGGRLNLLLRCGNALLHRIYLRRGLESPQRSQREPESVAHQLIGHAGPAFIVQPGSPGSMCRLSRPSCANAT